MYRVACREAQRDFAQRIRDQFVTGIRDDKVREELLRHKKDDGSVFTLTEVVNRAKAWEATMLTNAKVMEIHLFAGRAVKREGRKGSSRRQQPAYGAAVNEVARELLRSARSSKRENGGRRYIKHDGMIASPVGSCPSC